MIGTPKRSQKEIAKNLTGAPRVGRERNCGPCASDSPNKMIDMPPPPPTANADAIRGHLLARLALMALLTQCTGDKNAREVNA